MNDEQLKCLLQAATAARLDPGSLKPVNPWTQKGQVAETLQMSLEQNFPQMAAQFRIEAGETVSLAAAAAKAGITPMNPSVEKELLALDPNYIASQQKAAAQTEADLLKSLEKGAADLAATREKQQAQFKAQAGSNNSTGAHNRAFLNRLGVQHAGQLKGIPTRRLTGK